MCDCWKTWNSTRDSNRGGGWQFRAWWEMGCTGVLRCFPLGVLSFPLSLKRSLRVYTRLACPWQIHLRERSCLPCHNETIEWHERLLTQDSGAPKVNADVKPQTHRRIEQYRGQSEECTLWLGLYCRSGVGCAGVTRVLSEVFGFCIGTCQTWGTDSLNIKLNSHVLMGKSRDCPWRSWFFTSWWKRKTFPFVQSSRTLFGRMEAFVARRE